MQNIHSYLCFEEFTVTLKNNELAGGILPPKIIKDAKNHSNDDKGLNFKNISVVRLSDFLINIVGKRKKTKSNGTKSVALPL